MKQIELVVKNGSINGLNNKMEQFMKLMYNKREHLELLKKKSGDISRDDSQKCLNYSALTNCHLDWCIREHYLDLLENFRKGKIQTFEFCISFENTGKLTSDILDILESNLIILSPNEKSLGFSDLLEEVFDTCETYLQDAEFRDENSEVEFKNSVEEIYLKIQKYLNEE
jgi:hypothetical protein